MTEDTSRMFTSRIWTKMSPIRSRVKLDLILRQSSEERRDEQEREPELEHAVAHDGVQIPGVVHRAEQVQPDQETVAR